jgi:hypothetical protein
LSRLFAYDDESVEVAIIPQACRNCGERVEQVRMSLDFVAPGTSDFLGIRTVASTPCCGGLRHTSYPAEKLAALLNHLQTCTKHKNT